VHYKGPLPIGYGLRAAIRDKFPDIVEVRRCRRAVQVLWYKDLLHVGAQRCHPSSPCRLTGRLLIPCQSQVLMIDPDTEEPIKFEAI